MKILDANVGLLSNSEVLQVLKDRGADVAGPNSRAVPCERQLYEYLTTRLPTPQLSREKLSAFIAEVQRFDLMRAEVLQLLNAVPTTPVEVHLIVEDAERRLGDDKVEELLAVVNSHLGPGRAALQQQQLLQRQAQKSAPPAD